MLAVNGHAKHRQSLCRVGYGKTALSMDLFFITTANILSTHTFLLLSPISTAQRKMAQPKILRDFIFMHIILLVWKGKNLYLLPLWTVARSWDSSLRYSSLQNDNVQRIFIAIVIFKNKPALCEQQLLLAANKDKEWGMFERWIILLLLFRE